MKELSAITFVIFFMAFIYFMTRKTASTRKAITEAWIKGNLSFPNDKLHEWKEAYLKSPQEADLKLQGWKVEMRKELCDKKSKERRDEQEKVSKERRLEYELKSKRIAMVNALFPLTIPCSRCGSSASRQVTAPELTSSKYSCSFCKKTTIHRRHQDPNKRRREAIPESARVAVLSRASYSCEYCGSSDNLHIDHVLPFSKGGSNDIKNLQVLCRDCNLRKSGN